MNAAIGTFAELLAPGSFAFRLLAVSAEVALLFPFVVLGVRLLHRRAPRIAAALWLAIPLKALLGPCAGPLVAIPIVSLSPPASTQSTAAPPSIATAVRPEMHARIAADLHPSRPAPGLPSPDLRLAWRLGGLGVLLWIAREAAKVRRILRATAPPPPGLAALYREVAADSGVARPPRLAVSEHLDAPALVGWVRPVVVLPRWLVSQADRQRLVWALRHELAHHEHRDAASDLIYTIAKAALFFHPLLWWAHRRWRQAAEWAADRRCTSSDADAADYADHLVGLALALRARRASALSGLSIAPRGPVERRVRVLLDRRPDLGPLGHAAATAGVLAFSVLAIGVGCGHSRLAPRSPTPAEAAAPLASPPSWLGPGDGPKAPPPQPVGRGRVLAVGDVDGDGDPDLVASAADQVEVLLNNGTAQPFAGARRQVLEVGITVAAALADLDGDGDLDLALEGNHGAVRALFNDGTLSPFSMKRSLAVLGEMGGDGAVPTLAAADLDGDVDVDLITARAGRTEAVAIVNDGSVRPFAGQPVLLRISSPSVRGLAVGDLNGDARPDVALLHGDGTVELRFADQRRPGFAALARPATGAPIALRDFDGDRDLDIAVGGPEGGAMLINDGSARPFGPRVVVVREVAAGALSDTVDFDGDGLADAL